MPPWVHVMCSRSVDMWVLQIGTHRTPTTHDRMRLSLRACAGSDHKGRTKETCNVRCIRTCKRTSTLFFHNKQTHLKEGKVAALHHSHHIRSRFPQHLHHPQILTMKLSKKALANKVNSVRPYKSRTKRPCDFCRRRKTCCIIEKSTPCLACVQFNKGNCTFVSGPLKRVKRSDAKEVPVVDSKEAAPLLPGYDYHDHDHDHDQAASAPVSSSNSTQTLQPPLQSTGGALQSSFEASLSGMQSSTAALGYGYDSLPGQSSFHSPHPLSNSSTLGHLSPHTPAYSFQTKWGSGDSAQSMVVNGPPELRQLMLSNSSLLSNMSTVSALSMGTYQTTYDDATATAFPGYTGPTGWTDTSDYDSFVMEQMPEEIKRDYQALVLGGMSGSLMAPVQVLAYDHYAEAYTDPLVQME